MDNLYGCCVHCLDHPDLAHDDPCYVDGCPGAEPLDEECE